MWEAAKLGDVCNIYTGNSIPAKEKSDLYEGVQDGIPYVATKDVSFSGVINYANGVRIPPGTDRKFKLSKAQSTLICAEGGSAGRKIAFSYKDCYFVNKLCSVHSCKHSVLHPKFVYYYALSNQFQEQFKCAMHGLIPGVSVSKVREFSISYPPLVEQKRIATKLDSAFAEIDKAIAATERKKAEVVNLKRAVLVGEFSASSENTQMWQTVKLDDVCQFQSGLWKGKKAPFVKACVLRNTNFTASGKLSYHNVAELDVEKKQFENRALKFGDIILEKSGGGENQPVGRVCVFEKTDGDLPYTLSNFTSFIRVKNKSVLDYRFLHKVLYFMHAAGKTEPMQRFSTAIRNLQLTQYKNIVLFIPPLAEQNRIVEKLDAIFANIDKVADIATKQLANYQALKSAILKQELQGPTK